MPYIKENMCYVSNKNYSGFSDISRVKEQSNERLSAKKANYIALKKVKCGQ